MCACRRKVEILRRVGGCTYRLRGIGGRLPVQEDWKRTCPLGRSAGTYRLRGIGSAPARPEDVEKKTDEEPDGGSSSVLGKDIVGNMAYASALMYKLWQAP